MQEEIFIDWLEILELQTNLNLLQDGLSDLEIADSLADYFNRISCEFEPLGPGDVPCTRDKDPPQLHQYEVATRIRRFRKPKSTIPGDIFPPTRNPVCGFPSNSVNRHLQLHNNKQKMACVLEAGICNHHTKEIESRRIVRLKEYFLYCISEQDV